MADYYPLLARAVTGLQTSTPEARQAIYDRARGALLGQLRGIQPPLPAQDIDRESDALEAAVQRLEDEMTAARLAAMKRPRRTAPQPEPGEDAGRLGDTRQEDDRSADTTLVRGARPARAQRQRIEPTHPAAPAPPSIQQENKARFWIIGFTIVTIVGIIGATAYFMRERPEDLAKLAPRAAEPVDNGTKIAGRATSEIKAAPTAPLAAARAKTIAIPVPPPEVASPAGGRSAAAQPGAVQPSASPGGAIPATIPQPGATAGVGNGSPSPAASDPPVPATPTAGVAAPATPPATSGPQKSLRNEVPVTYRAALLVEAPEAPEHRRVFVGTVVWHTENLPGEPGQPLATAVIADVDIAEAKLKVSMALQRNTDSAFSASHTMTFSFAAGPGSIVKGVRSITLPQMRTDGARSGTDLMAMGIVQVTPTYYLVGLKQDPVAIRANLDMLESRNWIDLQFVMDDGKDAKIAFEKGAQGSSILAAAAAGWK